MSISVIDTLNHAIALGQVAADNENYLCPLSIKDAKEIVYVIRSMRDNAHKLREALRPFAELAVLENFDDDQDMDKQIRAGDVRKARAAYFG